MTWIIIKMIDKKRVVKVMFKLKSLVFCPKRMIERAKRSSLVFATFVCVVWMVEFGYRFKRFAV